MMRTKDGRVSCEVVKVVHDDSNKQVDHDEAAEEDEADKVEICCVAATSLVWVEKFASCLISMIGLLITRSASLTSQHDVRPGLSSGTSTMSFIQNSERI